MPAKAKPVIVTMSDEGLNSIDQIVKKIAAEGMTVEDVSPLMGSVAGQATEKVMSKVRAIPGVLSVEEEIVANLPPPDSDVQ